MITTSQLSENSHRGFDGLKAALYLGSTGVKSNTASGLPLRLRLTRIGSRSSGKERDAETGLDYFGARYYSAAQGRFITPDWASNPEPVPYAKLDNPQTLNLYAYVINNPLRFVDIDGHESDSVSCDTVYIKARIIQHPSIVKEKKFVDSNGKKLTTIGVEAKLAYTITENNQPIANVQVREHNDITLLKNGKPQEGVLKQGTSSTNENGQIADLVTIKMVSDGSNEMNNQITQDLKENVWTSTTTQTLKLEFPIGKSCYATTDRTLTNEGRNGPESKYRVIFEGVIKATDRKQ
jgi:RHS repeat-associated protein